MHKTGRVDKNVTEVTTNVIDRVIIPPHSLGAVHVGIYENVIPMPKLKIKIRPDIGGLLSSKLERKDGHGEYSLIYFFQNYSDEVCRITVSIKGEQYDSPHPA